MADDDYFGYDIAALRQASADQPVPQSQLPVPYLKEPDSTGGLPLKPVYQEGWYGNRKSVSYAEVPAPDDNFRDIDYINAQIMGEQPGTAEYRALQWGRVGLLLASAQNQLQDQTKELANSWESPQAKEIFLSKVGETLAYLDVWHEAASTNSFALTVLAGIMREGQEEMRELYAEYEAAIARSATPEEINRQRGAASSVSTSTDARTMPESGPPSTQGSEAWRARMRETMRTADDNKKNYDQWARELASRLGEQYTPVIQRLENGRARKMTTLNAVNHPGAYGGPGPMPIPPSIAPFGAPPGAAPSPPPGAPPAPPPTAPPGPPASPPTPKGLKAPDASDLPDAPKAPGPTALPTPGSAPTPGPAPTVPNLAVGAPGLSPETLTALQNALATLPPSLTAGGPSLNPNLNPSQSAQFTAKAPALPTAQYPPNTITPPPGGVPNQPKQQGKVLGQRAPQTPPPGQGLSKEGRATQDRTGATGKRSTAEAPEVAQAFQPPPAPNAGVLGKQKGKRARPGSATEAPASQLGPPPNATSPVVSNPRRGAGPNRTYREQRAKQRRDGQATPEIATGVPTGTAPVLVGRFAPTPPPAAEAPITLRGRAKTPAAPDQHARPEVHADRTTRAPRPADPVPAEQSTWEVETHGGPVVASGTSEKQYRTEPPNALGAS